MPTKKPNHAAAKRRAPAAAHDAAAHARKPAPAHAARHTHAAAPAALAVDPSALDDTLDATTELTDADADVDAATESQTVALSDAEKVTANEALTAITPRATALASTDVVPYRLVPALAIVNVRGLLLGLARFRPEIPGALPLLDLTRYDALEDTALALVAAANDADKISSDGEIVANLTKARAIRARLLPVLHGLAVNGHVPMKVYEDIAAGTGSRDVAKDCVDLPAAFRAYAAKIAGKHPISDADLAACDAVGTWLLRNLSTKGARTLKSTPNAALDLRNRVATLLLRDYGDARVIAHYFLRDDYTAVAPPLRSRFIPRRAAAPVPPPAPLPGSPPAPSQPSAPQPPVDPSANGTASASQA